MTLVFVQVGLFLGILDNASVTIDHIDADLWVTSRNTPNVDFAHALPRGTASSACARCPGVERADNLIVWFLNLTLPTGAEEGMLVYAPRGLHALGHPLERRVEGNLEDLRRGAVLVPRRLGRAALRRRSRSATTARSSAGG